MSNQAESSHGMKRFLVPAGAVALFIFFLVLSISTAAGKSAHFDETAHLMSGYFMLKDSDYRVNTANMVVSQKFAALPLMLSEVNPPSKSVQKYALGHEFIYGGESFVLGFNFLNNAGNNSKQLLLRGRMMMILVGLLAAVLVFFWSKKIFGTAGAMLSLAFLATCPVFISFSGSLARIWLPHCSFLPRLGHFGPSCTD